jgi:hypothetical protein
VQDLMNLEPEENPPAGQMRNVVDCVIGPAGEPERQRALSHVGRDQPPLVWYLHYSRESPEAAARFAHALEPHYEIRRHGFVAYTALDRRMMQWLGIRPPPEYVVEVLEFRLKS